MIIWGIAYYDYDEELYEELQAKAEARGGCIGHCAEQRELLVQPRSCWMGMPSTNVHPGTNTAGFLG